MVAAVPSGIVGPFLYFHTVVKTRPDRIEARNQRILEEHNQRRKDEARATHEAELLRVRTENQRREQEARDAHAAELQRVRAENERREASNRHAVVAVYNLDTGTIDMVWRGDPRLSGRSWHPEVQQ